jgi:hypothetical protein
MNMASPRAGPRGPQDRSPFVHFSVCIASDPTSSGVGSSQIGTRFVDFLNGEPIAGLTSVLTPCWREDHLDAAGWQRRALQLEAQLGDGDDTPGRARRRCCWRQSPGARPRPVSATDRAGPLSAQLRVLAVSYCPRAGPPRLAESKSPVPSCAPPPGCV